MALGSDKCEVGGKFDLLGEIRICSELRRLRHPVHLATMESEMSWTKDIAISSHVAQVGYDDESASMFVVWSNGRRSVYEGVPEDKAWEIAHAGSVGMAIHNDIKPFYRHRYG